MAVEPRNEGLSREEELARVVELAAGAADVAAVMEAVVAEFGEVRAGELATVVAAAFHERSAARTVVAAPVVGKLTMFEYPRMIDGYLDIIHCASTHAPSYSQPDAAEIFARWHAADVCRNRDTGRWLVWDGRRWRDNEHRKICDAMDHFLGIYGQAALRDPMLGDKAGARAQMKIATAGFISGTLDIFEKKQELDRQAAEFDADDWALNTPDGIVDLRTGDLIPHTPEALCTKLTACGPMPLEEFNAKWAGSRFAKFLDEIFSNFPDETERAELIAFEQVSLGYCLTGDSSLHFLKFWHGEGRNGKSTFGEVIEFIMGDYAKKINNQLLMASRNEAHPTDIANLMGARLVIASEISESAYLNETKVKELTGDARLSARFMRQDYFEFRRTHKHLIYGNHKPRIRVTDAAIKSRLKLTSFEVNFEERGVMDASLKLTLALEAPLILRWLVEGSKLLARNGMRMPRSSIVERATEDYMAEQDVVKLWIEERCILAEASASGGELRTKMQALYEDYRNWRTARGEHSEAIQRWSQVMQSNGFKQLTIRGARHFAHIGLKSDRDDF